MRSISRAEQETVIRWDAEEQIAHIDTANPATIRKLDKLAEEFPEAYKFINEDKGRGAKQYTVPAALIRIGKPVSEAQREARRKGAAVGGFRKAQS